MHFGQSDVIGPDSAYDFKQFGAEMTVREQNRWRSFLATLCLVAVAFLYAPFGAAAWAAYVKACCTSRAHCPIHGHHQTSSAANSDSGMNCGHDMTGMAQCTMSCCQNPDRPAVAPTIFVLAAPLSVSLSPVFEPFQMLPSSGDSVSSFEPLSPPPRFSSLAA